MKAVARLVWSYFTGTRWHLAFTLIGATMMVFTFFVMLTQPQPRSGERFWIAILGIMFFFVGSSLMPVMFGRLARGHSAGILPGGRVKLLLSMFATILLVAFPVGVLWPVGVTLSTGTALELMKDPRAREFILQTAALLFSSAVLIASWIYLALWFLTSQRNMAGLFKALLVIAVVIFAPAQDIQDFTVSLKWTLLQIAITWSVFAACFLLWPRFKAARARRGRERFSGFASALAGRTAGREFDVLLGTANPWLLVLALVLPFVIATRFTGEFAAVWLYFLAINSAIVGAYAGQAAERSRALWLRGDWSRAALFACVERSVWRHNGTVLGALLVLTVAVGAYLHFSPTTMIAGLLLLVLGTNVSTNLGLMMTRGLKWPEIVAGIAVMLILMASAELVAREHVNLVAVGALEVALLALAIVLRTVARRRWTNLDWAMCRPDRALTARGAS